MKRITGVGLILIVAVLGLVNTSVGAPSGLLEGSELAAIQGGFGCGTLAGATTAATVIFALGVIGPAGMVIGAIGFIVLC